MKNRNSSPAKSVLQSATHTASSPIPTEALGTQDSAVSPTSVLSVPYVPSVPFPSSASASSFSALSAPLPLGPSTPSDFAAAKAFIARKPATKAMQKLQSILDNHDFDYLNPDEVAQLSALMVVYAQLQNSAAVERISESLDQVGAGYKREPLTRELTKVLSIQDRALARAQREKAAKERDQRRIERETKREQAQAAKQARDERLFNQREDHLSRQEKIVQSKLEIELTKRANRSREQVNKHTQSQGATDSSSALSTQHSELTSQCATPPSQNAGTQDATRGVNCEGKSPEYSGQ